MSIFAELAINAAMMGQTFGPADTHKGRKIVLKRGPSIDLPGKPRSVHPRLHNEPLDEGEMAFSNDEGRLFVGADPARGLPQANRISYPYQNVEVIGENSKEGFARMHGQRMREGDNHDYFLAYLPASSDLSNPEAWVGFIDRRVIITMTAQAVISTRTQVVAITNNVPMMTYSNGLGDRDSTAYRYWRIERRPIVESHITNDETAVGVFSEMSLSESVGGPNIINQATILTQPGIDMNDSGSGLTFYQGPLNLRDGGIATKYAGVFPTQGNGPLWQPDVPGLVFDFGAGNEKAIKEIGMLRDTGADDWRFNDSHWITNTPYGVKSDNTYYVYASQDGINWGIQMIESVYHHGPQQWRYLPQRPIEENRAYGCGLYFWGQDGSHPENGSGYPMIRIGQVRFYDENGAQIPSTEFELAGGAANSVYNTNRNKLFNTALDECEMPSSKFKNTSGYANPNGYDEAIKISYLANYVGFWVNFKTHQQISRVEIVGPGNTNYAPINIIFVAKKHFYETDGMDRGGWLFNYGLENSIEDCFFIEEFNYTTPWTASQTRSFNVSIMGVNN